MCVSTGTIFAKLPITTMLKLNLHGLHSAQHWLSIVRISMGAKTCNASNFLHKSRASYSSVFYQNWDWKVAREKKVASILDKNLKQFPCNVHGDEKRNNNSMENSLEKYISLDMLKFLCHYIAGDSKRVRK